MNARTRWWTLTTAAVLACAATVYLGLWQLSRADQKNAIRASMVQREAGNQITSDTLAAAPDKAALHFQPAALAGEWLADRTIFLDNRQMRGRVGFYVVTPLDCPRVKPFWFTAAGCHVTS